MRSRLTPLRLSPSTQSSAQLVLELNKLALLADGVPTHAHAGSDSGPQGAHDLPKVVVIHLKGLKVRARALGSPSLQLLFSPE